MVELSHARLDEGDVDGARSDFSRAEELVAAESFGAGGRSWLGRLGTRLAITDDDLGAARRWAGTIADPFWRGVDTARVLLAGNDRPAGCAALEGLAPRCIRHEVVLGLLCARASDDQEESVKHASTAVEVASTHGLLQTVASEGPEAVELVELTAWRAPAEWMDRLRRAAADGRRSPALQRLDVVEPLTERERDVLRFLPSRLTMREIADELFISVNTLKFHLKLIYRKLGVSSRAEAAEVARRLARMPDDPS
jgi:LuxR family maltose regulon positive regulatory protein